MMLVRKKFLAVTALGVAATLTLGSCGKDPDGTEYTVITGDATGCIMGTVTDALTGARVDVSTAEIWAVFNGSVLKGSAVNGGDALKANVAGDYYICGVPNATAYDAAFTLPVHFKISGYQERIYSVMPSNDVPNRNSTTAEPGFWATPTVVQNAAVWKVSDLVSKDFVVNVNSKGAALAGATVWMRPTDTQAFALTTATGPITNLTGTTDASGNATFAAASLAFGATYAMTVVPKSPIAADGSYLNSNFTATIVIGTPVTAVTNATFKSANPFTLSVDMADAATSAPVLVSQTLGNTVTSSGTVILMFDRAVSYNLASKLIGSGTTAAIGSYGTKSDGTACVAADVGTPVLPTLATESAVSLSVSGSIVTITPAWTTAPTSTASCGGITLVYTLAGLDFYAKGATVPNSVSPANVTVYLTTPLQTP